MTKVIIRESDLASEGLANIVAANPKCTELVIEADNMYGSDLSELRRLPHLKKLVLNAPVEDLSFLNGLKERLNELDLAYVMATDFSGLQEMANLETLVISHTAMGSPDPRCSLSLLEKLPRLREITARKIAGADFNFPPLSSKSFRSLTKLNLAESPVRDTDLQQIAKLSNLTTLDLSSTPVSDLSALHELKALSTLSIADTPIDDPAQVVALTACSSLESIEISDDMAFLEETIDGVLSQLKEQRAKEKADISTASFEKIIIPLDQSGENKSRGETKEEIKEIAANYTEAEKRSAEKERKLERKAEKEVGVIKMRKTTIKEYKTTKFEIDEADLANIPDHWRCPITKDLMREPIVASDGIPYEKEALMQSFQIKPISPMTREPLEDPKKIKVCMFLKNEIDEFKLRVMAKKIPKMSETDETDALSPQVTTIVTSKTTSIESKKDEVPIRQKGVVTLSSTIASERMGSEGMLLESKDEVKADEIKRRSKIVGVSTSLAPRPTAINKFLRPILTAAMRGNAQAQFYLGECYEQSIGDLAEKKAEAVEWYQRAAEQGHARAQFNLGVCHDEGIGGLRKDKAKAMEWYQKAAEQGDADAQFNLGVCHDEGIGGLRKDKAKAVEWYQRAAEQGHARAQFNLGVCHDEGIGGLRKDEAKAVEWYQRAAKQGDAGAQFNLAICYEQGTGGLRKDKAKAMEWYQKAAEQGDADAQFNLGVCHDEGIGGLRKDKAKAVEWYQRAAEQGHARAQFNLGVCHDEGIGGLRKDEAKAVEWYQKAAKQKNIDAIHNLGYHHENGLGFPAKNEKLALAFYKRAAEEGDADAQANLGWCYEHGVGMTSPDPLKAAEYYQKAAAQKNTYALAVCYAKGYGRAKDLTKTIAYYFRAANAGHARAQTELGLCYQNGIGISQDEAEAVKWYQKASDQGYARAKACLATLPNTTPALAVSSTSPLAPSSSTSSSSSSSSSRFFTSTASTLSSSSTSTEPKSPTTDSPHSTFFPPDRNLLEQEGVADLLNRIQITAVSEAAPIVTAIRSYLSKIREEERPDKMYAILRELQGLIAASFTQNAEDHAPTYRKVFDTLKLEPGLDKNRVERIASSHTFAVMPRKAKILPTICPHLFVSARSLTATPLH